MLEIKKGFKQFSNDNKQVTALKNLNLTFDDHCFVAICGKSGSGKSTLLNVLAGNSFLTHGQYFFNGQLVERGRQSIISIRQKVGFIFQDYQLLDYLKVKDNILLPSLYNHEKVAQEHLDKWVKELGVEHCLDQYPATLSGGEKQRVAICRIMLYKKEIILADEPTGALDAQNSQILMNIFAKLHQNNTSIIMVTHNEDIAQKAERIIGLENGEIVY